LRARINIFLNCKAPKTTNVTESSAAGILHTPQTHTSSEHSDMIEVKARRYREAAKDTGCGNVQIEFLSPELEAGHNS